MSQLAGEFQNEAKFPSTRVCNVLSLITQRIERCTIDPWKSCSLERRRSFYSNPKRVPRARSLLRRTNDIAEKCRFSPSFYWSLYFLNISLVSHNSRYLSHTKMISAKFFTNPSAFTIDMKLARRTGIQPRTFQEYVWCMRVAPFDAKSNSESNGPIFMHRTYSWKNFWAEYPFVVLAPSCLLRRASFTSIFDLILTSSL